MTIEAKLRISTDASSISATRRGLESISQSLRDLRSQALAFFGLQQGTEGVAALARMSDTYTAMNARLRIATNGQAEFTAAMADAKSIAAQFNQPLDDTVKLYTRMLSAVKPLGGGVREASVATKAMAASLKISGASTAESGAAILQFSQAMSAGALRGEEFNSMADAAPRLLDALAAGMGKTKGELKGLAEQGALTTNVVIGALSRELPKLEAEAARIPSTISAAYQGLRDALSQYMGKQNEANGSAMGAVAVLKLLANNINVLMGLLQGIVAIGIAAVFAKGAASLVAMGSGVVAAAGGIAVVGAALRGLLALIGGPVGLIVMLGSLALGWLGVKTAQDEVASLSATYHRDQLNKAQKELASYKGDGVAFRKMLEDKVAALKNFADEERGAADAKAGGAYRGQRSEGLNQLKDPAGIKKFEDEYKTRNDIAKKYEDERANYVRSKDLEIADARKAGNADLVASLQKRKAEGLKDQARAKGKELLAFDTRDSVTSVSQAKHLYDQQLELLADSVAREKTLLQAKFDQGIVGLQAYLADKARLEALDYNQDVERINTRISAEAKALEANRKLLGSAKDANAKKQVQEAIDGNLEAIAKAQAEKETRGREADAAIAARIALADAHITKLRAQMQTINDLTAQGLGNESEQSIADRIQRSAKPNIEAEFDLSGDSSRAQALADLQVRQAILAKRTEAYTQAVATMAQAEEALHTAQAQGNATTEDTEAKLLALRRQQLPVLRELLAAMAALATSPAEKQSITELQNRLSALSDLRTQAQREWAAMSDSGRSSFVGMFGEIASGAKTASAALSDMLKSFASQMLSLIGKRLGAKLFESFGLGNLLDGGIATVASLFGFHTGGIVGPAGASFTRSMPAGAAALLGGFAPRYHSGGIAGFKPNERLAVLELGEEVLTQNDPRHRNNLRTGSADAGSSANTFSAAITVNVSGQQASSPNAGTDIARAVRASMDQWAMNELRPGGKLAR